MIRKPHPKHYNCKKDFVRDFVAYRVSAVEPVTKSDDYVTAKGKSERIQYVTDDAILEADERWDNFMERVAFAYENGVGPSWA